MPPRRIQRNINQAPCQLLLPSVDNLVDDTLRIIFEQCCLAAMEDVAFFEPREVLKLCLVSQRWNRVARDHAVLWTHIHIQRNKLAQLQFTLSRKAPLQIIYGRGFHMCQHSPKIGRMARNVVDYTEKNMDRVELLSFEADLTKLERLVSLRDLIPILFSTPAPQMTKFYMSLEGTMPKNCQFKNVLAFPFRNDVNGLTRFVVDVSDSPEIAVFILPILGLNPALEEVDIRGNDLRLNPDDETPSLVMECLKAFCIGSIYPKYLEAFFKVVSLPVIQEMELEIYSPRRIPIIPIPCLRDIFLRCPGLHRLLAFPGSLSLDADEMDNLTIHAVGSAKHEVRISVSDFDSAGLFRHVLEMFPNLNTLCVGPNYPHEVYSIGASSEIKRLELSSPGCHEWLQALKRHLTLPSLSQVTVRDAFLRNDDHWRAVLDLLPRSGLQKRCIVYASSDFDIPLSDNIRREILQRNIYFEFYQSSQGSGSMETGRKPDIVISPHSFSAPIHNTMIPPHSFSAPMDTTMIPPHPFSAPMGAMPIRRPLFSAPMDTTMMPQRSFSGPMGTMGMPRPPFYVPMNNTMVPHSFSTPMGTMRIPRPLFSDPMDPTMIPPYPLSAPRGTMMIPPHPFPAPMDTIMVRPGISYPSSSVTRRMPSLRSFNPYGHPEDFLFYDIAQLP